jgi:UDP-glucuronate 4-epimerase
MTKKNILITGIAGFIGYSLAESLINQGFNIIGIDNLNNYYDVELKYDRLRNLGFKIDENNIQSVILSEKDENLLFQKIHLEDKIGIEKIFQDYSIDIVINLAAQAGVRYSITNPDVYISSNIVGFSNLIEISSKFKVEHFIFASSSSVYGNSTKAPFNEIDNTDNPVSLYAATKKSNEIIGNAYHNLYGLNITGLRFFTVYGPWGRPDMAPMLFLKSLFSNETINIFNQGKLRRDFSYIDDIVNGINKIIFSEMKPGFRIYNIGNNHPTDLMYFISLFEKETNLKFKTNFLPMQTGDVFETFADITRINNDFGYAPRTSIEQGVSKFIEWYKKYYNII